jgi:hypothetical protein
LGYPYYTTQGTEAAAIRRPRLTLHPKRTSNITSLSCLMDGGYSPTESRRPLHLPICNYSDNNGAVGALIGQTETELHWQGGRQQRRMEHRRLPQPLHLNAGVYGLVAVQTPANTSPSTTNTPPKATQFLPAESAVWIFPSI